MWKIKTWEFTDEQSRVKARNDFSKWILQNSKNYEIHQIFVNMAYGIEYRRYRQVGR